MANLTQLGKRIQDYFSQKLNDNSGFVQQGRITAQPIQNYFQQRPIQSQQRAQQAVNFLKTSPVTFPFRDIYNASVRTSAPQIDLAKNIRNPYARVAGEFVQAIPNFMLAAPKNTTEGTGNIIGNLAKQVQGQRVPYQSYLREGARAIDLPLQLATFGGGKTLIQGGGKLLPKIWQGAKTGSKAGAIFGAQQGLKETEDRDTLKNIGTKVAVNSALGAGGGLVLGGIIGAFTKHTTNFSKQLEKELPNYKFTPKTLSVKKLKFNDFDLRNATDEQVSKAIQDAQTGRMRPIIIHPDGTVLDGTNRLIALQRLNYEGDIPVIVQEPRYQSANLSFKVKPGEKTIIQTRQEKAAQIAAENKISSVGDVLQGKEVKRTPVDISREVYETELISKTSGIDVPTLMRIKKQYGLTNKQMMATAHAIRDYPNVQNRVGLFIDHARTQGFKTEKPPIKKPIKIVGQQNEAGATESLVNPPKQRESATQFIKRTGIDPASIHVIDDANGIVESKRGEKAVLTELPIEAFGKPKFETLNQYKYESGRKVIDPIEVSRLSNGKYRITDGANRFSQAVANGDKTIPVILELKVEKIPPLPQSQFTSTNIKIVPESQIRNKGIGDYEKTPDGGIDIMVSNKLSPKEAKKVAVHEVVESNLAEKNKVPFEKIDEFDRKHIDSPEPGALKSAPYHKEHVIATEAEKVVDNNFKVVKPIEQEIAELSTLPPKKGVYGKTAEVAYKTLDTKTKALVDRISAGLKKYNVSERDFVRYIEAPETAPVEVQPLINAHRKLVETLHSVRENPSLGKIESYYPHMPEGALKESALKKLGDDLWISEYDLQLGTSKKRTGVMTEFSDDYNRVMKSYADQSAYEKYGTRMKQDEKTVKFMDKLDEHLKADEKGVVDAPNDKFNYAQESSVRQDIKYKKPVHLEMTKRWSFNWLRHNIEKQGHKDLSNTMREVRDIDDMIKNRLPEIEKMEPKEQVKAILDMLTERKILRKSDFEKALIQDTGGFREKISTQELHNILRQERRWRIQNLVDTMGKYELSPSVEKYLNMEVDRLLKYTRYEETFWNKFTNVLTGMFYRAHIWGNVSTAIQQKTEGLRIPALYSKEAIASGAKQRLIDMKRGEDILKRYDAGDVEVDISKQLGIGRKESLLKKADEKAGKVGNFMIQKVEYSKNRDFLYTAEAEGKRLGLEGKELYNFVRDELFANGFILHQFNTPAMLKNPAIRLALQYQQYNIQLINKLADLSVDKKYGPVAGVLGSQVVAAIAIAAVTGKSWEYVENRLFNYSGGPAVSVPYQIYSIWKDVKKNEEEAKKDGYNSTSKDYAKYQTKNLIIRNVIPFGNQALKSKRAIDEINRGYGTTYADRITYDTSQATPFQKGQAAIFGTSSFPQNKAYYRERDKKGYYSIGGQPGTFGDKKAQEIKDLYAQGQSKEGAEAIGLQRNIQGTYKVAYDRLSPEEQAAFKSIPDYEPDNPDHQKWKYNTLLDYPSVYNLKRDVAIATAKGNLKDVDPFYLSPDWQTYALGQTLQNTAYNSEEFRQFKKNHPEYTALAIERSNYFKTHPFEGEGSEYPQPSDRVQTLLAQKNYQDPEVQQYFTKRLEYINKMRAKQGLDPMDSYGNILGSGGFGGFGKYKKKVSIKLAKAPSTKALKIKLSGKKRLTKVKPTKNTIKLSKAKQPKLTPFKVSKPKIKFSNKFSLTG